MKLIKLILILSILICVINSCVKKEKPSTQRISVHGKDYILTVFPQDTTKLWLSDGSIEKDTVLIIGEGGPKGNLDFESSGRVYWEYLSSFKNYYSVVIHQSSTYNKTIFGAEDFNIENAEQEVNNSSEILYRTIKYFKDRNKYVVVIGHSYSAFIIPHYIATRPSLADKYIITGGRIDADSLQTAYQLKGINTGFEEGGKTLIIPDENEKPNPYRTNRYFTIRKNKELLKYAIGKHRYSVKLTDKDLSNVIFCYGKKDENVGVLTTSEIKFLTSKNAQVIAIDTDHYDIWKRVIDAHSEGKIKF